MDKKIFNHWYCLYTFLMLIIQYLFFSFLILKLLLEIFIYFLFLSLICRSSKIHFLNLTFLLCNFLFKLCNFFTELLYKIIHNWIFLVKIVEYIKKLFSLVLYSNISNSYLFFNRIKSSFNLLLFRNTLFILFINSLIWLFLIFDSFLIYFYLLL